MLQQLDDIQKTPDEIKVEDVSTINQVHEIEQSVSDDPEEHKKKPDYNSFIKDGVEVVDVKAIEKEKNKKKLGR